MIPALLSFILFRPVMLSLRNGQLSAFLLMVLVIAVFLWERKNWFFGGMALAFLILKPSLGVPITALLAGWALSKRHYRALGGLGLAVLALLLYFLRDHLSPLTFSSLSIPFSLLLTPYLWPYDQSLLILPLIVIMSNLQGRLPYVVAASSFLLVDLMLVVSSII